ncbi:MAG: phosphonate ABC transporter, permease protein PhnE [Pseudobdellovibrionaceae bacterium]
MKSSIAKRTLFDAIIVGYLLCVLLVVMTSPSEEQMLMLGRNTVIFAGALGLAAALSFGLNKVGMKTLGEVVFEPPHKKALAKDETWYKTAWGWELLLFVVITLVVGLNVTQASIIKLIDEESFYPTMKLFNALVHPNWNVLPRAVLMMIETMFLAFIATGLAIPIAFVACFFAAKNIMKHPAAFAVYLIIRTILNITRSIEAFVWAIIFTVWVGIGPFAGMLALMIHSIASLTKQYSELVETVSEGPIEGIQSTGANMIQTIWFAIVPQVILPFISFTVYRWDINIRMATIVGFVGGGGIGYLLQTYASQAMWAEVGTIIVVIAFVVWFMDTASAYIREALK